jgi:hypothetical protein
LVRGSKHDAGYDRQRNDNSIEEPCLHRIDRIDEGFEHRGPFRRACLVNQSLGRRLRKLIAKSAGKQIDDAITAGLKSAVEVLTELTTAVRQNPSSNLPDIGN